MRSLLLVLAALTAIRADCLARCAANPCGEEQPVEQSACHSDSGDDLPGASCRAPLVTSPSQPESIVLPDFGFAGSFSPGAVLSITHDHAGDPPERAAVTPLTPLRR